MAESSAELWWNEVTGPSQMVRNAADELRRGRSVLLRAPADLPWPDQMRASMETEVRADADEILIDYVDWREADPGNMRDGVDIGVYLLDRYAKPQVRDGYRRSSRQSVQDYTVKNGVFRNRVVWVTGLDAETSKAWSSYCRDYRPEAADGGVFVLECMEEDAEQASRDSHGLSLFVYDEHAGYHDVLLFTNQICAPLRAPLEWKQYLAAVATELCGRDAELADTLLQYLFETDFRSDPIAALEELSGAAWCTDRFLGADLDPSHPFALLEAGRRPELEMRVWRAQVQILFPMVEYEHVAFVRRFFEKIKAALREGYVDRKHGLHGTQYITKLGERVTDPYDVEIGTLYLMNKLRSAQDESMFLLYLYEGTDRDRLALLRDVRNQLAHVNVCPAGIVNSFMEDYPYEWRSWTHPPKSRTASEE